MKKVGTLLAAVSILSFFFINDSFAQGGMRWKGSSGWGNGTQYSRMYDLKTVGTIKGEVVSVDKIVPMKGMSYGIHLTIKTDAETASVHVGPEWYIEYQDVKIEPKDKVEITGSRINLGGKSIIIAAEIKKGDEILKLRDENGFPVWSGWRRR